MHESTSTIHRGYEPVPFPQASRESHSLLAEDTTSTSAQGGKYSVINGSEARGFPEPGNAPVHVEILVYDNRGIGKSSVPGDKRQYSTDIMSEDAVQLMDSLGWSSAHVVGFSMGGMIATKLASHHPRRVQSLLLLSVTAGGWQVWRVLSVEGDKRLEA